jgi:site-specific recombinase XerD
MKPPRLKLVKGFSVPPQDTPPSGLDEAIALFLRNKRALDDGTQVNYQRVLRRFQGVSPDWPPTNEGIIDFVIDCRLSLKKSTIHSYWSVVHNFVNFLVKQKLIAGNPLDGLSPPEKPDELPRAPFVEQVERLVRYLENEVEQVILLEKRRPDGWGWRKIRDLALFSLIIDTGPRISEALGILLEDIDLTFHSAYIRNPKGPKTRFVFFGKKAKADLSFWLNYRKRLSIPEENSYLFPSLWGGFRQLTPVAASHTLERICTRLEIAPAINPHDLRHFYVSSALDSGNPEYVRQQVGHANLETTSRYARSRDPRRIEDHLRSSPRDRL